MARKNGKPQRPGISSKVKTIPSGLDWSDSDRNAGTLKKILKASQEEKELDNGKAVIHIVGNEIKKPKIKKAKKFKTGLGAFTKDDLEYDDYRDEDFPIIHEDGFARYARDSEIEDMD